MKLLIALLLTIFCISISTGQKLAYNFDYKIDMEMDVSFGDTTTFKNYKRVVSYFLNSKNDSFFGSMLYGTDSTDIELTIIDLKKGKNFVIYPYNAETSIVVTGDGKSKYEMIKNQKIDTTVFVKTKNLKKIQNFNCGNVKLLDGDYELNFWFTKDIPNIPKHSFYSVGIFNSMPISYQGMPIEYISKDGNNDITKNKYLGSSGISLNIAIDKNKLFDMNGFLNNPKSGKN